MRKEHFLMILCTFFLATGQFFHKIASTRIGLSIEGLLLNWPFLLGLATAGIGALIMTFALREGELSTLFPYISLSFVWTALIATFIFGEQFLFTTGIGILFIIAGVTVLGRAGAGA